MNDDAIITALLANLGDPKELVARAKNVETPNVSHRAEKAFERKYALLGRAAAHNALIKFLGRLKQASDADKARKSEQSKAQEGLASEAQYKSPTTFHLRNQTAYPSNIGPTISFGGVEHPPKKRKKKLTPKEELERKLDAAFKIIDEELSMERDGALLAAELGQFIVDGEIVIDNHADLLKILVMWLVDNRPEVLQSAVDSIGDMVRSGTAFRK